MAQPPKPPESFDRKLTRFLRPATWLIAAGRVLLAAGRLARTIAVRVLEVVLALLLLFEEWGWRPLSQLVGRLRELRLWARFEDWIETLPPYPSLLVFLLPTVLLLPLKLAAVWLVATGHVVLAGILFVGAKLVGTAFVARLFLLLQPKLMAIGWFARAYNILMPWKIALFARIRASWAWRYGRVLKERVKRVVAAQWDRLKPRLQEWWMEWRPRLRAAWEDVRAAGRRAWQRLKDLYPTNSSRL